MGDLVDLVEGFGQRLEIWSKCCDLMVAGEVGLRDVSIPLYPLLSYLILCVCLTICLDLSWTKWTPLDMSKTTCWGLL